MADGTPVETLTPKEMVLFFILFFSVLSLLTMARAPVSYDPCSSTSHLMSVNFSREDNNVTLTWLGGYDSSFVDNLQVKVDNQTYGTYPVPYTCEKITTIQSSDPVYIEVYGFDRAARIYREIWSQEL